MLKNCGLFANEYIIWVLRREVLIFQQEEGQFANEESVEIF
jgi:hypothetical protein